MSNPSNHILKIGHVLTEKWVVIEFIGKGAMGEVHRAHQLNLKRDVAIKVVSQEMLQSFEGDREHDLIASWLVDYFLPLLEGVEAMHSQDIVHRYSIRYF